MIVSTSALDEGSLNDVQVVDQPFHVVRKHGLVDTRRSTDGHLVGRLADYCFFHPPFPSASKTEGVSQGKEIGMREK